MTELQLDLIAVIGFGEAGSILGAELAAIGRNVVTYDILFDSSSSRASMLDKARASGVRVAPDTGAAMAGAGLVISAVTASSSLAVASEAGRALRAGQVFLDINSVSPATKRTSAATVESGGADYVEAAVMAPVPPQRLKVPMLLGGARSEDVAQALRKLGMNTTAISDRIGVASAVKMCRSIVIKGIEALTVESMLAARRFGAEEQVLASLNGTFPGMGWQDQLPDYLVSRVAEHGRRRSAEMREVAKTLQDVDLEPTMALAIAARQEGLVDAMNARGVAYPRDGSFSWRALADALKEVK
jgi:3-hydroxyisobutyrate dehydrogenase-like beta-hydroxyacid dehydrogenase